MDRALVDRIARTVLYEGYVLYPYRPSSLKNTRPWTFGILYPESFPNERSALHCECLLTGDTSVSVVVRFLQVTTAGNAIEREVPCGAFSFPAPENGEAIQGEVTLQRAQLSPGVTRLILTVQNTTPLAVPDRDSALLRSFASAHAVLSGPGAQFISLTDPPPEVAEAASACVNTGVWPVLIGRPGERDTLLASPIILSDYPQVAPESAGDLYDATEIEEILTLRILTLTDAEKAEIRASDDRARALLDRAETLPAEHLMRLHGTIRGLAPARDEAWSAWDTVANAPPVQTVCVDGADLHVGDRVRLRPHHRADIFDSALAGRTAVIEAIEQDFEDQIQLAVVVEDDPGRDLGEMRQAGHRFFFRPSEVEPIQEVAS